MAEVEKFKQEIEKELAQLGVRLVLDREGQVTTEYALMEGDEYRGSITFQKEAVDG
jgi:predicted peroxiredoxin